MASLKMMTCKYIRLHGSSHKANISVLTTTDLSLAIQGSLFIVSSCIQLISI